MNGSKILTTIYFIALLISNNTPQKFDTDPLVDTTYYLNQLNK